MKMFQKYGLCKMLKKKSYVLSSGPLILILSLTVIGQTAPNEFELRVFEALDMFRTGANAVRNNLGMQARSLEGASESSRPSRKGHIEWDFSSNGSVAMAYNPKTKKIERDFSTNGSVALAYNPKTEKMEREFSSNGSVALVYNYETKEMKRQLSTNGYVAGTYVPED